MPAGPHHHCSLHARFVSQEPAIGSASGFTRCFLLEVPLPWTKNAIESKQISEEIQAALNAFRQRRGDVTVTLLVPDPTYAVAGSRIIDIEIADGQLSKRDVIATDGDIAAAIRAMAGDDPYPDTILVDTTPVRDIIVCTHGSRDACCATFGAPLHSYLHQRAESVPATRVWRSSHLGGHRFAPTMIDYPSGRAWGFVDQSAAESILLQDRPVAELRDHLRGWIGYPDASLQMLEGEIFAHIGWEWDSYRQRGTVLECDHEGRGVQMEITGTHPTLPPVTWRGGIEWGEEFTTIASCLAAPVTYTRKQLVSARALPTS